MVPRSSRVGLQGLARGGGGCRRSAGFSQGRWHGIVMNVCDGGLREGMI